MQIGLEREARYAEILRDCLPDAGKIEVTCAYRIDRPDGSCMHIIEARIDGMYLRAKSDNYEVALKAICEKYRRGGHACAVVLPPVEDAPMPPPQPIFEALGEMFNPYPNNDERYLNGLREKAQKSWLGDINADEYLNEIRGRE